MLISFLSSFSYTMSQDLSNNRPRLKTAVTALCSPGVWRTREAQPALGPPFRHVSGHGWGWLEMAAMGGNGWWSDWSHVTCVFFGRTHLDLLGFASPPKDIEHSPSPYFPNGGWTWDNKSPSANPCEPLIIRVLCSCYGWLPQYHPGSIALYNNQ